MTIMGTTLLIFQWRGLVRALSVIGLTLLASPTFAAASKARPSINPSENASLSSVVGAQVASESEERRHDLNRPEEKTAQDKKISPDDEILKAQETDTWTTISQCHRLNKLGEKFEKRCKTWIFENRYVWDHADHLYVRDQLSRAPGETPEFLKSE